MPLNDGRPRRRFRARCKTEDCGQAGEVWLPSTRSAEGLEIPEWDKAPPCPECWGELGPDTRSTHPCDRHPDRMAVLLVTTLYLESFQEARAGQTLTVALCAGCATEVGQLGSLVASMRPPGVA